MVHQMRSLTQQEVIYPHFSQALSKERAEGQRGKNLYNNSPLLPCSLTQAQALRGVVRNPESTQYPIPNTQFPIASQLKPERVKHKITPAIAKLQKLANNQESDTDLRKNPCKYCVTKLVS